MVQKHSKSNERFWGGAFADVSMVACVNHVPTMYGRYMVGTWLGIKFRKKNTDACVVACVVTGKSCKNTANATY